VELHGYTHMYPDSAVWAQAPDRYDTTAWYRELGAGASAAIALRAPECHPLELGMRALREHFGVVPTTLIPPGAEWTDVVLERALELGLQFVDSYYLALRDANRFCWSTHVCSPYLDEAESSWFTGELPVVGYFHDREPAIGGAAWIGRCLDQWREAGATRF